jgi:hypothetical protein
MEVFESEDEEEALEYDGEESGWGEDVDAIDDDAEDEAMGELEGEGEDDKEEAEVVCGIKVYK